MNTIGCQVIKCREAEVCCRDNKAALHRSGFQRKGVLSNPNPLGLLEGNVNDILIMFWIIAHYGY